MDNQEGQKTDTLLHTAIVQTSQMQVLAEFYGGGLGLGEPQATGNDHLGFQLANVYLGFDQVELAPRASGVVSLWFEVDDIGYTFRRFLDLGAKVKYAPVKKIWGAILAALFDPDGNVFGITQRDA